MPPVEVTEFSKDGNLRGMPVGITCSRSASRILLFFFVNLRILYHSHCLNSGAPQEGNFMKSRSILKYNPNHSMYEEVNRKNLKFYRHFLG